MRVKKMWKLKPKLCVVGNKMKIGRQWERRHLYSNVSLPVSLYSILKRWICCCYLYLWIHAIWPSVKWLVILAQQEELALNLQSPHTNPPSFPFLPSTPSPPPPLLIPLAQICWIWMQMEEWEWEREREWRNSSQAEVGSVTSFSL